MNIYHKTVLKIKPGAFLPSTVRGENNTSFSSVWNEQFLICSVLCYVRSKSHEMKTLMNPPVLLTDPVHFEMTYVPLQKGVVTDQLCSSMWQSEFQDLKNVNW